MATLLYRLGAFGARRWRTMLIGWLLGLVAVVGLGVSFAGSFADSSSIPGSPAQTALTKMEQHFPEPDAQSAQIVFQAPAGHKVTEPDLRDSLKATLEATGRVPGVSEVSDPARDDAVSRDGRTAVAEVTFATKEADDVPEGTLDAVRAAGMSAERAGLRTIYGGEPYETSHPPVGPGELLGLGVALVILVITFGSLLAAGLPLLTAVLGIVATVAAMMGLATVFDVSDNAPTLAIMLGLAVGIDYALFIVSRHRAQLSAGMPVKESIARATATAGSAVVFAGATVLIALAGLSVAGVPMLTSMGLASAGAVAVAVLTALTLLPALMAMAGHRLTPRAPRSAVRRRRFLPLMGRRRAMSPAAHSGRTATMGVRWTEGVLRHPVRNLILGTAMLIALAVPGMELKLALTDEGSGDTSSSSRQAYDVLGDAFGPGANGPLVVLVENDDPATVRSTATAVEDSLRKVDGIADVSGVDLAQNHTAARIQITPETGPRSEETSNLVARLRTQMQPLAQSSGSYVAVTGMTAVSIDVSDKLSGALVPFVIVVVGLSLLLLTIAFRSIAIPVKATIGFLLSVGAAFGATVAVFQWGWLAGALGVPSEGPVASFVPIVVMSVLFGLAMDYEVFLVSAMREDYNRHHHARTAILNGARNSARVVTSAALIMISVFVSFLFSHDADIMPIAFALAFGVMVDAFLVRMTLVPAILALLGDRAWWLPRRLDRVLPHLDVEGENFHAPQSAAPHAPAEESAPAHP
ncbi:RND superfamily putative drug exporter [Streptomyces sp. SAI-135]|uniref:MMPL family transporter n=1 Tax=unclassified Streptomyces TaxID=2593676 RepID=UPI00247582D1|nr:MULTISPECIES: MMPL family transporter [unclassified Streptomyces]MDH6514217.1 RND superfamily putative drug exporter [Streptomyces sp. SAI-090]MDH6621703.1 RND superfamily putative drug exporter [Streptomyces sp. SAI-135]